MKKTLLIALLLLAISSYGQDTTNFTDKNGLKQGYWQIKNKNKIHKVITTGNFLDNKKIGVWKYELHELRDTTAKGCQQLSTYLDKSEEYFEDGSIDVITYDFFYRPQSKITYSPDSSVINGEIYLNLNSRVDEKKKVIITCLKNDCKLKTKSGNVMDTFNSSLIDLIIFRVTDTAYYDRYLE